MEIYVILGMQTTNLQ